MAEGKSDNLSVSGRQAFDGQYGSVTMKMFYIDYALTKVPGFDTIQFVT